MDNMIPVVGKKYKHYDDGKIRYSRESIVVVVDIIKFEDAPDEIVERWEQAKYEFGDNRLFCEKTDYFVVAYQPDDETKYVYARSFDMFGSYGWYSFNDDFWNGRLDVVGNLMKKFWS